MNDAVPTRQLCPTLGKLKYAARFERPTQEIVLCESAGQLAALLQSLQPPNTPPQLGWSTAAVYHAIKERRSLSPRFVGMLARDGVVELKRLDGRA